MTYWLKKENTLKLKPHALAGNWIGYIDAHIQPNWVLIYKINKSDMSIDFVRMVRMPIYFIKRAMSKSFSHSRMIIGEFHVAIKKQL